MEHFYIRPDVCCYTIFSKNEMFWVKQDQVCNFFEIFMCLFCFVLLGIDFHIWLHYNFANKPLQTKPKYPYPVRAIHDG